MKAKEILERLLRDMTAGRFAATGKLPSESALCRRFGASLMTVRGALAELQRRGLIEKRNGIGSFLTKRALRKSGIIGLVIPDLGKFEFFSIVRKEIARHCARLNYRVELVTTDKRDSDAALTTVAQPVGTIAATAFKVLLARIRYPNNEPREIFLPAPIVVRAST